MAIFFFGSWVVSSAMIRLTGYRPRFHQDDAGGGVLIVPTTTSTGSKISGLLNPANLLEGLRTWVVGRAPVRADVPYPGSFGVVYLAVVLGMFALCVLLLMRRYQKASLL